MTEIICMSNWRVGGRRRNRPGGSQSAPVRNGGGKKGAVAAQKKKRRRNGTRAWGERKGVSFPLSPFPMGGKCEQKKLLPLHKDEGKGTAESGENKKKILGI